MEETKVYAVYYRERGKEEVLYARSKDCSDIVIYCSEVQSKKNFVSLKVVEVKQKTIFTILKGTNS